MKYTRQERLEIGRKIFEGDFSVHEAAEIYGVNFYTARGYLRTYKAAEGLREEEGQQPEEQPESAPTSYKAYLKSLSRKELEDELMKMKKREEKLKELLG